MGWRAYGPPPQQGTEDTPGGPVMNRYRLIVAVLATFIAALLLAGAVHALAASSARTSKATAGDDGGSAVSASRPGSVSAFLAAVSKAREGCGEKEES